MPFQTSTAIPLNICKRKNTFKKGIHYLKYKTIIPLIVFFNSIRNSKRRKKGNLKPYKVVWGWGATLSCFI